jgi:hypothetical protein
MVSAQRREARSVWTRCCAAECGSRRSGALVLAKQLDTERAWRRSVAACSIRGLSNQKDRGGCQGYVTVASPCPKRGLKKGASEGEEGTGCACSQAVAAR